MDTITPSPTDVIGDARLEARKLSVQRGERILFRDLQIQLHTGQALLVAGPNGAGKTTLLRTLCGLSQPSQGSIHWRGHDIS